VNRSTLLKEVDTDTADLMEQVADLDDLVLQFDGTDAGLEGVKTQWSLLCATLNLRVLYACWRSNRFLCVKKIECRNESDYDRQRAEDVLDGLHFSFSRVPVCQPKGRDYSRSLTGTRMPPKNAFGTPSYGRASALLGSRKLRVS
jgi:hypothetical protein